MRKARKIAERSSHEVKQIDGVVDARIIQRLDYPQYVIEVDRAKAAALGLTQVDVMQNVVAAFNSSIQFNKKNFWIDPVSHNQYYVGVQYPEETSSRSRRCSTSRSPARARRSRSRCGTSSSCRCRASTCRPRSPTPTSSRRST